VNRWTFVFSAKYTYDMSHSISAVFNDGVFRPLEPVDWPDGTRAEVIVSPMTPLLTEVAERCITWPAGYFEQTAGALACEEFERPPQGDLPAREDW
jgi:predicted DNA-binding antitoxin AbrB/MazE fold protein